MRRTEPTTLLTERLRLESVSPEDAGAMLALFREPGVRRYLLDDQLVSDEWVAEEILTSRLRFAQGSAGLWGLRIIDDPSVVGIAGFRPFFEPPRLELLYALHPRCWGRGLATEAARAVCAYAVEVLGMTELHAATDVPNAASARVLERLGMRCARSTDEGSAGTRFWRMEPPLRGQ